MRERTGDKSWYYLKTNHRVEVPRHLFFFDCETRPEEHKRSDGSTEIRHRFWFAHGAYLRSRRKGEWCIPRWYVFDRIEAFWEVIDGLCARRQTLHVFAHNLGFDLRCVDGFFHIPRLAARVRLAILDDPPTIIRADFRNGKVVWLDTLNWWRVRVSDLGERIGLPKLDFPGYQADRATWDAYCRRDVEVIMASMRQWLDWLVQADMGSFKPTLAGQSLSAYRHRFMDHKILLDRDPLGLKLSREAYHGGRVECFRLGEIKGPVYQLDINSQYPAVMHGHDYPAKFLFSGERPDIERVRNLPANLSAVARVDIETEQPVYPLYVDGKLIHPVGRFETTLTTPELRHAFLHGHIKKVHAWAVWFQAPIFKRFIREIYSLRQEAQKRGDQVASWQYKILMNALYGKWAQRGRSQTELGECDSREVSTELYYDTAKGLKGSIRKIFGKVWLDMQDGESAYSHPAIAAHITAYARMLLWDIIKEAGNENTFYCDTDSVFVNERGRENLGLRLSNDALGALKIVGKYDRMAVFGAKDYIVGDKRVLKGVREQARVVAPGIYEQEQWVGLAGAIQAGILDAPIVRLLTKTLKRQYDKGTVGPDGRVTPYRLPLA